MVMHIQPKDSYITLTATNAAALDINTRSLAQLRGKSHFFSAQIVGEFPASFYPTEEKLEFKQGAQVMFIKNDPQPEKRYFNGKIGRIVTIDDESITVRCDGEEQAIIVTPDEWKNVKYVLNETTKEIEEHVLGSFTQYPLKLAWAITIHKSQGLTFERAIIDAQAAFAHGQVYVALSRCKSFEGIVLRSRIDATSVKTDPVVQRFSADAELNPPSDSELMAAKRRYQQSLIEDLFSFDAITQSMSRLRRIYQEHQSTLTVEAFQQVGALARKSHEVLNAIADKFRPQLNAYFQVDELPEANSALCQRIVKAVGYFTAKLTELTTDANAVPKLTDNQAVRKSVDMQLQHLQRQLFVKHACFLACSQSFSAVAYKRAQFDAELDFTNRFTQAESDEAIPEGIPHPQLYKQLLQYRQTMADKQGISPRGVLTSESLRQLVIVLPTTQSALRKIHGIAKKRLERYGRDVEGMIRKYCEANQIPLDRPARSDSTPATGSATQQLTMSMFQEGKSIEQIATERALTISTIQGHLAFYVEENQLDIHRLLDKNKLEEIERYFSANPTATIGDAKTHFGPKFEYGELRLAQSYIHRTSGG